VGVEKGGFTIIWIPKTSKQVDFFENKDSYTMYRSCTAVSRARLYGPLSWVSYSDIIFKISISLLKKRIEAEYNQGSDSWN
jgi:hypothetical protein